MARIFASHSLAYLADTASSLAAHPSSLDDGGAGSALLHAALFPLATQCQLQDSLAPRDFPGAAAAAPAPLPPPPSPAAATRALLQCLSSPCASSETVTLAMVGLCLCWGCCASPSAGDSAACEAIASALAPPPAAAAAAGTEDAAGSSSSSSSSLPAALSSGFLGLLNALCTSRASGEEQACLDVALREPLATLPLRSALLTSFATGLLAAALRHCAGMATATAAAAAAAPAAALPALPSPLLARAAAGPRLLYASDARVAVDIALRAASDGQGGEVLQGWLGVLRALQVHCCPDYRREEVEGALGAI